MSQQQNQPSTESAQGYETLLAEFEAFTARVHQVIRRLVEPYPQWLFLTHPVEREANWVSDDDYSRITAIGKHPDDGSICCWLEDNASEFGPTMTLCDFTTFDCWTLMEIISRLESKEFTLLQQMPYPTQDTGEEAVA